MCPQRNFISTNKGEPLVLLCWWMELLLLCQSWDPGRVYQHSQMGVLKIPARELDARHGDPIGKSLYLQFHHLRFF